MVWGTFSSLGAFAASVGNHTNNFLGHMLTESLIFSRVANYGQHISSRFYSKFCSLPYFSRASPSKKLKKIQFAAMSRNHTSPRSPNAPSSDVTNDAVASALLPPPYYALPRVAPTRRCNESLPGMLRKAVFGPSIDSVLPREEEGRTSYPRYGDKSS